MEGMLARFFSWKRLESMRSDDVVDWLTHALRQKNRNYALVLWVALLAFILADTSSLFVENLVPDAPSASAPLPKPAEKTTESADQKYPAIVERDVFSSLHTIPEEGYIGGPATRTRLAFTLVGTLIFDDTAKSIATINDTSLNRVFPVQVGDSILDKARIENIENYKVVFTNLSSGVLEYVDMPHDEPLPPTEFQPTVLSGVKKTGINALDETHYEVRRTTIDESVANLTQVLQDANAIPNFENGNLNGYKVVQVKPGSMFDQLGIKMGDVISNVNGTPVNDPAKALQLLSDLKNLNQVTLAIKRNGAPVTLNYSLR